LIGISATFSS